MQLLYIQTTDCPHWRSYTQQSLFLMYKYDSNMSAVPAHLHLQAGHNGRAPSRAWPLWTMIVLVMVKESSLRRVY